MKQWFSASEIAGLPRMPGTPRGVNKMGDRGEIPRREREQGKGWEYAFTALPAETQAALLKRHAGAAPTANATTQRESRTYDPETLWDWAARRPQSLRDEGTRRAQLLQQVVRLMETGRTFAQAANAVALANGLSAANLRNWYYGVNGKAGAKSYATCDWAAALIPGYTGRTAEAACSAEAWDYFRADFLRLEQPTATACYERLQGIARERGWEVPSLRALERRIKAIPKPTRVYLREGEQALLRLYPALERTVRDLHALEWINGDGYQHNVFVRWPNGEVARPKTWFWQDVYSRRVIAWRTDTTEHTEVIRLSFGELVERYGIPDHVTIDNTRAAANKWMTGGVPNRYRFKVKDDDPLGVFPQLDIKVHWTSVHAGKGHGQAKPIERAFGIGGIGEYVDKHPALAGCYTGNRPDAKPENYGSAAVDLQVFLQVLEQGVAMWNAIEKRDTEICGGVLSFDQAFAQSYERAAIRKATAEQRRLWLLTAEAVKVAPDGTVTLEAGGAYGVGRNRYGADVLLEHIGQKMVVRFDPQRLHENVHVYALDGRYLGQADCIHAAGWGDTDRSREHNRARKQKMRATRELARAEQRMSVLEAGRLQPATPPAPTPETKVVRPVFTPRKVANGGVVETNETQNDNEENFKRAVGSALAQFRKDRL